MAFQGFLTDSSGTPRGSTATESVTIAFRLYNTSSALEASAIWGETQTVVVDKGHFSVVLGEGTAISGVNNTLSAALFSGNDTDNGRYLGIKVGSETSEIAPRIQFFTSPYSFLSRYATELVGTGGASVLKVGSANVGINLSGSPSTTLDVGGTITSTGMNLSGTTSFLQLGSGISGRQADAGKFGYQLLSTDSLDIVGAGASTTDRKLMIWAEGGTTVNGDFRLGTITAANNSYSANQNAWGKKLYFSGASPTGTQWDSENSDPLYIGRFNVSSDKTRLRISVGDYTDSNDQLEVGYSLGGTNFVATFAVDVNGSATASGVLYANGSNTDSFQLDAELTGSGVYDPGTLSVYRSVPVSIVAANGIRAGNRIMIASDQRIKDIVGQSNGRQDLEILRQIQVTDYRLKDSAGRAGQSDKKVIAQQVEKVFRQAVTTGTGVVPDIQRRANVLDGWVMLETDLREGDRVRIVGKSSDSIHEVTAVESAAAASPKTGRFQVVPQLQDGVVLVHGREVRDFKSVDYDAISMLHVSATQELIRQVEAQNAEIIKLREELGQSLRERQKLTANVTEMDARLMRLEASLRQQARGAAGQVEPRLIRASNGNVGGVRD